MRVGPVDVLVCSLPDVEGAPSLVAALREALDSGGVALIDVVMITRSAGGVLSVADADGGLPHSLGELIAGDTPMTLISDRDVAVASETIGDGQTGLVLALEHRWSRRLSERLHDSGGRTSLHERVPHETVVRAFEADGTAAT